MKSTHPFVLATKVSVSASVGCMQMKYIVQEVYYGLFHWLGKSQQPHIRRSLNVLDSSFFMLQVWGPPSALYVTKSDALLRFRSSEYRLLHALSVRHFLSRCISRILNFVKFSLSDFSSPIFSISSTHSWIASASVPFTAYVDECSSNQKITNKYCLSTYRTRKGNDHL